MEAASAHIRMLLYGMDLLVLSRISTWSALLITGARVLVSMAGTLSLILWVCAFFLCITVDCVAMVLMIWVFDGLRTINKDKDVGTVMVQSMQLATTIGVVSSLLESGIAGATSWIARSWGGLQDKKWFAE